MYLYEATPQYNPNLIYKGIPGLTRHVSPNIRPEPSTPEHALQMIREDELISSLQSTVMIAHLLASILYKHLHTHCTLWHTDSPGPCHSPRDLRVQTGTSTDHVSSFLEDNITFVHAICNPTH
jgi:hypothetical protein